MLNPSVVLLCRACFFCSKLNSLYQILDASALVPQAQSISSASPVPKMLTQQPFIVPRTLTFSDFIARRSLHFEKLMDCQIILSIFLPENTIYCFCRPLLDDNVNVWRLFFRVCANIFVATLAEEYSNMGANLVVHLVLKTGNIHCINRIVTPTYVYLIY